MDRDRERVCRPGGIGQNPVDHQELVTEPDRAEFSPSAGGLSQRRPRRARHMHQAGAVRSCQCRDRGGIDALLLVQSRQRAQATGVAAASKELAPTAGQLQQSDGVPGRRGVEQHMVVTAGLVGEQGGELVERRDLSGTRPRQLLGHRRDIRLGQHTPHRCDDPLPIRGHRLFGVDLQSPQPRHPRDPGDRVADGRTEHLPDIRCRIGRDQQHRPSGPRQPHRRRARDRGLADPALAGEEHKPRHTSQELHLTHVATPLDRTSSGSTQDPIRPDRPPVWQSRTSLRSPGPSPVVSICRRDDIRGRVEKLVADLTEA